MKSATMKDMKNLYIGILKHKKILGVYNDLVYMREEKYSLWVKHKKISFIDEFAHKYAKTINLPKIKRLDRCKD